MTFLTSIQGTTWFFSAKCDVHPVGGIADASKTTLQIRPKVTDFLRRAAQSPSTRSLWGWRRPQHGGLRAARPVGAGAGAAWRAAARGKAVSRPFSLPHHTRHGDARRARRSASAVTPPSPGPPPQCMQPMLSACGIYPWKFQAPINIEWSSGVSRFEWSGYSNVRGMRCLQRTFE